MKLRAIIPLSLGNWDWEACPELTIECKVTELVTPSRPTIATQFGGRMENIERRGVPHRQFSFGCQWVCNEADFRFRSDPGTCLRSRGCWGTSGPGGADYDPIFGESSFSRRIDRKLNRAVRTIGRVSENPRSLDRKTSRKIDRFFGRLDSDIGMVYLFKD